MLDAYDGSPTKNHALGSDTLATGPIHWEKRDKVTASFAEAAIEFIDNARAKNQPFFVNVWPDDVHSPFFPPQARRGNSSKRELYLGDLKTMDEQLGPLFDYIRDDPSLRDNTLVIVCSDNGPEDGAGSAGPFRGHKTMLYEGGIRSPLVVWGPRFVSKSKSGSVNTSSVVAAIDMVPSLLEIAGVSKPGDIEFDGEALQDVLLGNSEESRIGPLFFRRPPDRAMHPLEGDLPDLAVRDGRWKLLCEFDGSQPQLYDLNSDCRETQNRSVDHPEHVERLTTALLEWHDSMPAADDTHRRRKLKKLRQTDPSTAE